MPQTPTTNTLYYGDNLRILRDHIADESVDLVYLDPPFNSNATYNVLFRSPAGEQSQAQIEAFEDSWHWNEAAEKAFDEVIKSGNSDAAEMLRAMRSFLKENDMMAYLAMMAVRLLELHRVLKPTGSLYLHCDPTASHYLKILLDAVFGPTSFRNEIIWKRTTAHSDTKNRFSHETDTILFYARSEHQAWHSQHTGHAQSYIDSHYRHLDADGRRYRHDNIIRSQSMGPRPNLRYEYKGFTPPWGWRVVKEKLEDLDRRGRIHWAKSGTPYLIRYLDEQPGEIVGNSWDDIPPVNSQAQERLGYPTQKPVALLERIIAASSNEGDVVLDPFCGCGTTVHAAQKLNRRWIGIDVTHLAIALIRRRLIDAFPQAQFEVHGVPKDVEGARALAEADKHQFQLWALSMLEAQPYKGGQKGADRGVDGYLYFKPDGKVTEKAIVSVKGGGHVSDTMVKDLITTVEHENAKMGVFVTLTPPTQPMKTRAVAAGFYETEYGQFSKIQILTIEDLFKGQRPHMPWIDASVFKKAKREQTTKQNELDL